MAKKEGKELTPMMKQFFDLKAKHPDAVMLFRCGDFYETYCEDAITASKMRWRASPIMLLTPICQN